MKSPILIGNAQGFWGDSPSAAKRLLEQVPELDYLTLDYLAEVSLSIMAIQKKKNPSFGYARDFLSVLESTIPFWQSGSSVKIVSNCGGLNPIECAEACKRLLKEKGLSSKKIAVITGDDVLEHVKNNPNSNSFNHLDTQESANGVLSKIVSANAYIGADGIKKALDQGADVVITGRVADPSLVAGICSYHFNWSSSNYNAIAGATIAGHLIECGTQVTGGISTNWLELEDPVNIGFPVVKVKEDGSCIVTKGKNTGGEVSEQTVKEQILYEISDPGCYLSPDVTLSFLSLNVKEIEKDQVLVTGAKGRAPTATYKVSATYKNGFKADGMLTIVGFQAYKKAKLCGEVLLQRLKNLGFSYERSLLECLGSGDASCGILKENEGNHYSLFECVLRVSVADQNRDAVEAFTKELASLVTSGAQGVTGYTSGRPKVRPIFEFWPCLIEKKDVKQEVILQEAVPHG